MPRLHLTNIAVQRLSTIGIYYDTTTPAFGIRVGKHRKAWVITQGTDRQRISIGHYPSMSLAEARKEAKKRLANELVKGARLSFSEAYGQYKLVIAGKKPRTQKDYKRHIDKYFAPKLGKKKLPEITYEHVMDCVNGVSIGEKNHALAVVRIFFRWCVRPPRRYIVHSPLEGVQIAPSRKRKRVLDEDEQKKTWRAAGAQGYPHGTVVRLLLLSGQRRGETANLRWPWIDEKERTITLPDWLTKNGKEHTFPYGDLPAAVLDTIPRRNTTDLLFPSKISDDRPISGWSKFKKEMIDELANWTLHDLRRTYRTTHAKIGTPSHIGERLINHAAAVQTDVEAIYDRYKYMPEMRAAVERYEGYLSKLLAA